MIYFDINNKFRNRNTSLFEHIHLQKNFLIYNFKKGIMFHNLPAAASHKLRASSIIDRMHFLNIFYLNVIALHSKSLPVLRIFARD